MRPRVAGRAGTDALAAVSPAGGRGEGVGAKARRAKAWLARAAVFRSLRAERRFRFLGGVLGGDRLHRTSIVEETFSTASQRSEARFDLSLDRRFRRPERETDVALPFVAFFSRSAVLVAAKRRRALIGRCSGLGALMRYDHEYIILGGGPGGVQLGYFFERAGRDYVILERGGAPARFSRPFRAIGSSYRSTSAIPARMIRNSICAMIGTRC